MKYFSLKKYLGISIGNLCGFACILAFVIFGMVEGVESLKIAAAIIMPICSFLLLLPGAYYLYLYFKCKKKADSLPRLRGTVCNWELGVFSRYYASVSVMQDGKEYSTSHYLSCEYARELVGQEIEYCIIDDDILFIFEIISQE